MIIVRFLVFFLSFGAGIWIIRNAQWGVRTFGHADWAEKYFGTGGSYTVWKIVGILVIVLGFLYAVGTFNLSPGQSIVPQ